MYVCGRRLSELPRPLCPKTLKPAAAPCGAATGPALPERGKAMCSQILFVAGVAMTIGARATVRFFLRRKNVKVRAFTGF